MQTGQFLSANSSPGRAPTRRRRADRSGKCFEVTYRGDLKEKSPHVFTASGNSAACKTSSTSEEVGSAQLPGRQRGKLCQVPPLRLQPCSSSISQASFECLRCACQALLCFPLLLPDSKLPSLLPGSERPSCRLVSLRIARFMSAPCLSFLPPHFAKVQIPSTGKGNWVWHGSASFFCKGQIIHISDVVLTTHAEAETPIL